MLCLILGPFNTEVQRRNVYMKLAQLGGVGRNFVLSNWSKMMKTLLVISLITVFALAGCTRTYAVPIEPTETLSEDVAVRVTKKALEMYGADVPRLEPAPYRSDSSAVLAKNVNGTDNGYVIWRRIGETGYSYSVSISREGRNWVCNVGATK